MGHWRENLPFSKSQRRALFLLLIIIALLVGLNYTIPYWENKDLHFEATYLDRNRKGYISCSLEVNTATISDLLSVGILSKKMASTILNYRNALGGYVSVEQLKEVYGMDTDTFNELKEVIVCSGVPLRYIKLHKIGPQKLKKHPYISYALAKEIFVFKENNKSALTKISLNHFFERHKVSPYLIVYFEF